MCCLNFQVNTGGVISFSADFPYQPPGLFPSTSSTSFSFAVAPFWAGIDTRAQGLVRYQVFTAADSGLTSGEALQRVSDFVNGETSSSSFAGTWMLLVSWEDVQEFRPKDDDVEVSSIVSRYSS